MVTIRAGQFLGAGPLFSSRGRRQHGRRPGNRQTKVDDPTPRSAEHADLTQQVWFMMPPKINRNRAKDHPSPFPELLPARLIRLYTFSATNGATNDFPG